MSVLGVGEVLGGFIINGAIDFKNSSRFGLLVHMCISSLGFVILIYYVALFEYSSLAFAFAFLFGYIDSATSTHLSMICGFELENKSVEAIAIMYLIRPIVTCITIFLESFLKT